MSFTSTEHGTPQLQIDGSIARLTLRRPAHRNRLQAEDLSSLMASFAEVEARSEVRVLLLQAQVLAERPVFSAGYHAGEFAAGPPPVAFEDVADALERLRCVTLCVLEGSVYGGATDLVLACDLAIASDLIEMRMPAAALGLHYYPSGLRRYVERLGIGAARRAFLTAEAFDADTLLRVGFVQELLPRSALAARADALAAQIASLAPLALQTLKQSFVEMAQGEWNRERLQARERFTQASEDFAEGLLAFQQRRAPVWKGH